VKANCTINSSNDYCVSDEQYLDMIHDYIWPSTFEWCLIVFYVHVFGLGVVGNALVCFVIWNDRRLRTVTNMSGTTAGCAPSPTCSSSTSQSPTSSSSSSVSRPPSSVTSPRPGTSDLSCARSSSIYRYERLRKLFRSQDCNKPASTVAEPINQIGSHERLV